MAEIALTKIETAMRQLDTAIWLWFNEGDIVSVVQLTGAAFGVLDDLFHHEKLARPMPFSEAFAPEGMKTRDARNLLKAAQVFAKHARTDPDQTQEYRDDFAAGYLFLAVGALNLLMQASLPGLRSLFNLWYGITYPDHFNTPRIAFLSPKDRVKVNRLKKLSRIEFFKETGGEFVGNPPRYKWYESPLGHIKSS